MKVFIQLSLAAFCFIACTECMDMIGNREVKVFQRAENFFTAFENCKYLGMDLLMINNATEHFQAIAVAKKYNIPNIWLPVTDIGHETLFVSLNTGKRLGYANWGSGQPNKGKDSRCVHMWVWPNNVNGWNNGPCYHTSPYFCEVRPRGN